MDALKAVCDPELNVDVVTLGLIYNVDIAKDIVSVRMTLTTPFCPFGGFMVEDVKQKVKAIGAKDVKVEVTFEPPWKPPEGLREQLGL